MASFGVRIYCYGHGTTLISVNLETERSGANNDNCQLRIQRRRSGQATKTLPLEPHFVLQNDRTSTGWTWVDEDVPSEGEWEYVLQIKRLDGEGSFFNMMMNAIHHKR